MKKTPEFYNTTKLKGSDLGKAEKKAKNQEDAVFELFKADKQKHDDFNQRESEFRKSIGLKNTYPSLKAGLTSGQVIRKTGYLQASVSRSLSNLVDDLKLVKTDEFRKEHFGRRQYIFRIRPDENDKQKTIDFKEWGLE